MDKLELYNKDFFSNAEYTYAEDIMKSLDPSTLSENDYVFATIEGQTVGSDYQGQCVKQPRFKNSIFNGTKFDGIYGQTSRIINCKFNNSRFKDAGMAMSDFSSSQFYNSVFDNCGCLKSNFSNTIFKQFFAKGSVFNESLFVDVNFESTEFLHCTFENAQFKECVFKDCDLIHTTLEYASFSNISFNNVTLPFWGVLKSFSLLKEIKNQSNVYIRYSDTGRVVQIKEFFEILTSIQPYLFRKEEYFALANINIFFGEQENALYYILLGLDKGLKERDFRTVRFLCKLASYNIFFTRENLRKLYDAIINNSYISDMNNHEYQIYLQEVVEIKRLLLDNPFFMPQMIITCHTSFEDSNYSLWVDFIDFLESKIKESIPQAHYHFNIRHNSPPIFEIPISDNLPNLYEFATVFLKLCVCSGAAIKFLNKLIKLYENFQTARHKKQLESAKVTKANLENALLNEELQKKHTENELSLSKLEKMKENLINTENKLNCTRDDYLQKDFSQQITSIKIEFNSPDEEELPLREYYETLNIKNTPKT